MPTLSELVRSHTDLDEEDENRLALLQQPLKRDGGYLDIPTGPGLGLEIDWDAVAPEPVAAPAKGDPRFKAAHDSILKAIETVLVEGPRTPDMGGNASTSDVGKAVADCVQ